MENNQVAEITRLGSMTFDESNKKPLGGINPYSEAFDTIGKQYKQLLIEHAGLNKNSTILDIGCGTGRLAKQLSGFKYFGFDNNKDYISYCKKTYDGSFEHIDIHHEEYNVNGKMKANKVKFPYKSGKFDIAVTLGVYNHFHFEWIENYIEETIRVLKPRGVFFGTFLLLNDQSVDQINSGKTKRPFIFENKQENGWYHSNERPLLNVAIPETPLRRIFIKNSLMIREPIRYGQWCNSTLAITGHDIIIAKKGGWQ